MSLVNQEAVEAGEGNFSFWVAVAFTCNYIVGTGFLTLPFAFHSAGVFLSLFVMLIMGFMSVISVDFILVAMARATEMQRVAGQNVGGTGESARSYTAISRSEMEDSDGNIQMVNVPHTPGRHEPEATSNPIHQQYGSDGHRGDEQGTLNSNETLTQTKDAPAGTTGGGFVDEGGDGDEGVLLVKDLKFEVTDMCDMFVGKTFKSIYACIISVYIYGTLWVFSAVFGNALAYHLEIGGDVNWSYSFYLVLFACLVVPTSCMELKEQVYMQCILAGLRVLMMVLMLGTLLPSLLDPGIARPFVHEDGTVMDSGGPPSYFRPENIHHIISIGAYAFIFHHSVPALAHPISDKRSLSGVFATTIFLCLLGYCLLGIILGLFFGNNLEASANLNWSDYVGSFHGTLQPTLFSEVVAAFIVLFPALDVASAFPLNAITLGNNLMSAAYPSVTEYRAACKDRFVVSCYRVLAAAPPILGAGMLSDLGNLTAWTGLTGLLVVFVFPAILCLVSEKELKSRGLCADTYYSGWTGKVSLYGTLATGALLAAYCAYCLVALPPRENEVHEY